MPDFHGADLLAFLLVDLGREVDGHEEGRHADEDVLDHLDGGRHLHGLGADEGAGRGHGAGGVDGAAYPGAAEDLRHAAGLDDGRDNHHHDGREGQGEADGEGELLLLGLGGGSRRDGRGGAAHGHVGGNDDVEGRGFDLQELLAEDVGAHQDDGGDDPGDEDAGDADGHQLVDEHVGAKEHEAGLDEVLDLGAVLEPLGAAHGVGDEHADDDGPDFGVEAPALHHVLLAEDLRNDADCVDAEEAEEELHGIVAHEAGAEGHEHAEAEAEHGEGAVDAERLLHLLGNLGRVAGRLLPLADGGIGRIVEGLVGVLGAGRGCLGRLGELEGLGFGGLGRVNLGQDGGVGSVSLLLGHGKGIQRIGMPGAGGLQVAEHLLQEGQVLALHLLQLGLGLVEFNGFDGFLLFGRNGLQERNAFLVQGRPAVHDDAEREAQNEKAKPYGPVILFFPQI